MVLTEVCIEPHSILVSLLDLISFIDDVVGKIITWRHTVLVEGLCQQTLLIWPIIHKSAVP